ncbi:glycosyltransferase family 22 protein [Xylariomycetidae sp. FL0641]|nr:glycosyltransferase family 22 protein [Xylariomycetidae sp. FL0641]
MAPKSPKKSAGAVAAAKDKGASNLNQPTSDISNLVRAQAQEALAVIFAVRLANALCVRTFFQPDEYFQALEPAWQMVFGDNSGAWLTWEWKHQLRSSLHPAVFALGYFIVDNFWASYTMPVVKAKWLVMVPKLMQTGFASLGDWYTWRLAEKLYGPSTPAAWSVLLMTLCNPWNWYTATRTFSNCFETTLTAMALYYFPWEVLGIEAESNATDEGLPSDLFAKGSRVNSLRKSLVLAAFAVLLRPTNALIWLAVGTLILTRATMSGQSPLTGRVFFVLFREAVLCGLFALTLSLVVDRQYFGDWTFPPFTWLHFNVAQDLAVFYGENPWHYYLSQGIPLLCTTISPFVLTGLVKSLDAEAAGWPVATANALKALSFVVATFIAALSFVSHKEVRFINPLLPAFHLLAAPSVTTFFTTAAAQGPSCPAPGNLGWKRKPLLALGLLANAVIGTYLASFHASAPISVLGFLRGEFERVHPTLLTVPSRRRRPEPQDEEQQGDDDADPQELFALFLTPCHATPWRSHLVYPHLHARALTCDPPVGTAPRSPERANYQDETRRFYRDPAGFLAAELWPRNRPGAHMARYVVAFEGLEGALRAYFDWSGPGARHKVQLKEVWRSGWNGLFTDDDRKAGRIVVWDTGFYDEKPASEEDEHRW